MVWTVEYSGSARKRLLKLGHEVQERVLSFMRERVIPTDDPRQLGAPLRGEHSGLWRYRIGDYRIICRIEDARLVVLVISVGHRREVYD